MKSMYVDTVYETVGHVRLLPVDGSAVLKPEPR